MRAKSNLTWVNFSDFRDKLESCHPRIEAGSRHYGRAAIVHETLWGMKTNFRWLAVLVLCLLMIPAQAAQLAVGDAVPAIAAKDQHGKEFVLTANVQFLLVATAMAGTKIANPKISRGVGRDFWNHITPSSRWISTRCPPWHAILHFRKCGSIRTGLCRWPRRRRWRRFRQNQLRHRAGARSDRQYPIRYWNPASEPVETVTLGVDAHPIHQ
jgi:hypothetical protein